MTSFVSTNIPFEPGSHRPNMTIPGTGISLNTPDAIEAWIAERKKNWPTAERVAEKVRLAAFLSIP